MKNAKIVQCDKRGQIVIPKRIRVELGIEEGSAFWTYLADGDIMLKKVEAPNLKKRR